MSIFSRVRTLTPPPENAMRNRQRRQRAVTAIRRATLEALEPRTYLTTLYWEGGTGNWSDTHWNTASDMSGSTVAWSDGDDAVFKSNSNVTVTGNVYPGTVTFSAGNVSITDGGYGYVNAATVDWTGGNLNLNLGLYSANVIFEGGAATCHLSGTDGAFIQNGGLTWTSGNVNVTNSTSVFEYVDINLDGGQHTFTLDGSGLTKEFEFGGNITWTSGTLALINGASFILQNSDDPETSTPLTIPEGHTVTLSVEDGSTFTHDENTSIINEGTLNWIGNDISQFVNVDNQGTIFFSGAAASFVSVSGSSTATEGSTYTLTIGSSSIGSIDSYIVDWGDGVGYDGYDTGGAKTYTYGGSTTPTTDYTISVHLLTSNGAYVTAATKTVTVSNRVQAPTGVAATADGADGIEISWTDDHADNNITYDIEVKNPDSDNWYLLTTRPAYSTSYHWDNWSLNDLDFRVRAVGYGESANSAPATMTGDNSFLNSGDAHDLSISGIDTSHRYDTSGFVTITWNHTADYGMAGGADYTVWIRPHTHSAATEWVIASGYELHYSNTDNSSTTTRELDGYFMTWPGGVDVVISSGLDNIPSNIVTVNLNDATLPAPTNVTAAKQEDGSYLVQWSPSLDSGDTTGGYDIYSTSASDPFSIPHFVASAPGPTTSSAYVSAEGEDATFFVIAHDHDGATFPGDYTHGHVSPPSNVYDDMTPGAPSNVQGHVLGSHTIGLTWSRVYGADGYVIRRSTTGTGDPSTWDKIGEVSVTSFDDSDTGGSTGTYYYAMYSFHNATPGRNYSPPSDTVPIIVTTVRTIKLVSYTHSTDSSTGRITFTLNLHVYNHDITGPGPGDFRNLNVGGEVVTEHRTAGTPYQVESNATSAPTETNGTTTLKFWMDPAGIPEGTVLDLELTTVDGTSIIVHVTVPAHSP